MKFFFFNSLPGFALRYPTKKHNSFHKSKSNRMRTNLPVRYRRWSVAHNPLYKNIQLSAFLKRDVNIWTSQLGARPPVDRARLLSLQGLRTLLYLMPFFFYRRRFCTAAGALETILLTFLIKNHNYIIPSNCLLNREQ